MSEKPKMVWDPRTQKFVPLETDGQRVLEEKRLILLRLGEVAKSRDRLQAEWLEACEAVRETVREGVRYGISLADMAKMAGVSRQAISQHLPSIEEEEAELAAREAG